MKSAVQLVSQVWPLSSENAQSEFLRLGADVEIIEPAELRARISAVARSLAAIYCGQTLW